MKDKSNFQEWKELGNLRFKDKGENWLVYKKTGDAFVYVAIFRKIDKEGNQALHDRAQKFILDK